MKTISSYLLRRMALAVPLAMLAPPLVSHAAAPPLPPYPVLQGPKFDLVRNANTVIRLDDGNLLLAGQMFDKKTDARWGWLAKTDGAGKLFWDKELGKKAQDAYFMGAAPNGNGVLLVGNVNEGSGNGAKSSGWIVAVAEDGRILWDRALDFGSWTGARHVERTGDGTFMVAGEAHNPDFNTTAWAVRVGADGQMTRYPGLAVPDKFDLHAFAVTADGGFLLTGNYFIGPGRGMGGWMGRFGADGKPQWARELGIETFDTVVKETADGSIVLAANGNRDAPVQVMRLSAAGKIVQAPAKTGLCSLATLWRARGGQLRLAGVACPGKYGSASTVGLVADLAHPEQLKKIDAIPGGTVLRLVPLPERDAIAAQGDGPRQDDRFSNVIVTLPAP